MLECLHFCAKDKKNCELCMRPIGPFILREKWCGVLGVPNPSMDMVIRKSLKCCYDAHYDNLIKIELYESMDVKIEKIICTKTGKKLDLFISEEGV